MTELQKQSRDERSEILKESIHQSGSSQLSDIRGLAALCEDPLLVVLARL
jgi:hypothetical protein